MGNFDWWDFIPPKKKSWSTTTEIRVTTHSDTCLYLCLDGENCLNNLHMNVNGDTKRYYVKEFIQCVKYFRMVYGYTIPIVVVVVNPVASGLEEAKEFLKNDLNYWYVELSEPDAKITKCGFDLKALGGKFIESTTHYTTILHWDLDMYLFKKLPKHIIDNPTMGVYTPELSEGKLNKFIVNNPQMIMDTGLIVSKPKEIPIFSIWWDLIYNFKKKYPIGSISDIADWYKEGNPFLNKAIEHLYNQNFLQEVQLIFDAFEEYIAYEIIKKHKKIQTVKNYQFGEWYRYSKEHEHCCFLHYHMKKHDTQETLNKMLQQHTLEKLDVLRTKNECSISKNE